ncbi:lipoprotein [Pedobacter namyangjuensis]|uniref:lipoprotein n=1 Tax=Pedobacter namyangjuensis TaxID=600626 RepID=UPI0013B3669C|nr:lipoprotein [Pedobacter namyangjuensis]
MNRILVLFLLLAALTGCKKKDGPQSDPLHQRWYLYKIERQYTDKLGNPHPDFKPRSEVVEDRQMFFEFTSQGAFLTYEGNGSYRLDRDRILFELPHVSGEYNYRLSSDELILSSKVEGNTYNESSTFTMKPF